MYYPPPPSVPRVVYIGDIGDLPLASKPQSGLEWFLFHRAGESHGRLDKPFGLAADDHALYVCDTKRQVVHVFDLAARRHQTFGESGVGRLIRPVAVALDGTGNRYVADADRGEVVVFDADGEAVRAIRPPGDMPFKPVDVAIHDGRVYVINGARCLVQILNPMTGGVESAVPKPAARSDEEFGSVLKMPSGIALDGRGRVYVADALIGCIHVFDANGSALASIGRPGDRAGEFARPKHLAFGPDGILFVVDAAFQRVQMFDPSGRCLMLFGGNEEAPGSLTMPAGITISRALLPYLADRIPDDFQAEYLVFVSDQFGPWGVRIYAFGGSGPNAAASSAVAPGG